MYIEIEIGLKNQFLFSTVRTPPKNQPCPPFRPPTAGDGSVTPTPAPPPQINSVHHHVGGLGREGGRGRGRGRGGGGGRVGEAGRKREGAARHNIVKDSIPKSKPPVHVSQ